jgi:AraC family transcriptional regulator of adaptative response/methylated-DNA-[protein]-cysteine methyltransferase
MQKHSNLDNGFALEQEHWWQAVLHRDIQFDGAFVYAVRSTGIYCRPSCPSRRPGREQVVFFSLSEVAEQAGFRACRRCHPQASTVRDPQVALIQHACRYIEANLETELTLEVLAAQLNLSPHHLQRTFKRVAGITPRQYAEACRLTRFKAKIYHGETVTSALYGAGYSSSSRLYERASTQLGMTPATYRRGGVGMKIRYTVIESLLGYVLVAATEQGICSITLGDSDTLLETDLLREYPAAEINRDDAALGAWVSDILNHLRGQHPNLDLPLDVQATAFQRRVWQALRETPYGSTRSYKQVAEALGEPKAVRAVARACATNRVALAIPCHRVVREDGSLGGYRWGLERKQSLLAEERAAVQRNIDANGSNAEHQKRERYE